MTPELIIAIASVLVSAVAAFYAYKAPSRAADRAEKLRKKTRQEEREYAVFHTLMAERGRWAASPSLISALNSAKVVFSGNPKIVDALYKLHKAAVADKPEIYTLYFDLLESIAEKVGVTLRREDLEQFFISKADEFERLLREAKLAEEYQKMPVTKGAAAVLPPEPDSPPGN